MKRLLIAVIITAFAVSFTACSLNDSMTKATNYMRKAHDVYYGIVDKIRVTAGDAVIAELLNQYTDEEAASYLIRWYEDRVGEKFSATNTYFLRIALTDVLAKLRKDLTKPKESDDAIISLL